VGIPTHRSLSILYQVWPGEILVKYHVEIRASAVRAKPICTVFLVVSKEIPFYENTKCDWDRAIDR
jgi:hypothetical protein